MHLLGDVDWSIMLKRAPLAQLDRASAFEAEC